MTDISRRSFVRAAGLAAVGGFAGCSAGGSNETPDGDVAVGPGGSYAFDPEEHAVSVGDTVTWSFASAGHNVSCDPDASDAASLPDGAEPFASHDEGSPGQTDPRGATFEHTFEVAGEYTYVCVPHVRQNMVGTVVVEE